VGILYRQAAVFHPHYADALNPVSSAPTASAAPEVFVLGPLIRQRAIRSGGLLGRLRIDRRGEHLEASFNNGPVQVNPALRRHYDKRSSAGSGFADVSALSSA